MNPATAHFIASAPLSKEKQTSLTGVALRPKAPPFWTFCQRKQTEWRRQFAVGNLPLGVKEDEPAQKVLSYSVLFMF
jgi:hypothetical protein